MLANMSIVVTATVELAFVTLCCEEGDSRMRGLLESFAVDFCGDESICVAKNLTQLESDLLFLFNISFNH